MRTKIKDCNGDYALVHFLPDSEQEQSTLSTFKNYRADVSIELTVLSWVEKALLNEGYGKHSVVSFERVKNNLYYIFKVQKISSLGGY